MSSTKLKRVAVFLNCVISLLLARRRISEDMYSTVVNYVYVLNPIFSFCKMLCHFFVFGCQSSSYMMSSCVCVVSCLCYDGMLY